MRRALLLLVAACSGGSEADPCLTKLAPLNQPGAAAACTGVDAVSRAFRACVIAAVDTPGVAACLEPLRDAHKPAPPAVDAGVVDAAAATIDPTTLPEIPVPAGGKRGEEVELFAVDAPAAGIISLLVDRRWHLAASSTTKLTGHLVAPSPAVAAAALGDVDQPVPHGHAKPIDLRYWHEGQYGLFNLAGVLVDTSVVAPGDLPLVDIIAKRIPADAVLAELAKLDGRTIVRDANVSYFLPPGTTLLPLPKLATSVRVGLLVRDGTATQAMAALRAVAPVPLGVCGTQKLTLSLSEVKVAEAVRAIAVASGAPIETIDRCPLADEPAGAKSSARPVAVVVASVGRTNYASTIVSGAASTVVHDDLTFSLPMPDLGLLVGNVDNFVHWVKRTSAVMRTGTRWSAVFEMNNGELVTSREFLDGHSYEKPKVQIDPHGATINGVLVPLRKL